jgi:hypothetical protein
VDENPQRKGKLSRSSSVREVTRGSTSTRRREEGRNEAGKEGTRCSLCSQGHACRRGAGCFWIAESRPHVASVQPGGAVVGIPVSCPCHRNRSTAPERRAEIVRLWTVGPANGWCQECQSAAMTKVAFCPTASSFCKGNLVFVSDFFFCLLSLLNGCMNLARSLAWGSSSKVAFKVVPLTDAKS